METLNQIFIYDLTLKMSVGIYEHEKENKQNVIISVTVDVDNASSAKSIKDVVSYEDITNEIIALSQERHFDLLEELAENIANICLNKEKARSAEVKLEKPNIIKETKSVGVLIKRSK